METLCSNLGLAFHCKIDIIAIQCKVWVNSYDHIFNQIMQSMIWIRENLSVSSIFQIDYIWL